MYPVSAEFLDDLQRGTIRVVRKMEVRYGSSYQYEEFTDFEAGDVNIDYDDGVRTANVTVINPEGIYNPENQDSIFWFNNRFRLYRGIVKTSEASEWVPLGTFYVTRPRISVENGKTTLEVEGKDATHLLQRSNFEDAKIYTTSTSLSEVVISLCQDAGIDSEFALIEDAGYTLARDFSFSAGSTRWEALQEMVAAYSMSFRINVDGEPILENTQTYENTKPCYEFVSGKQSTVVSISKELNTQKFANHIIVIGGTDIATGLPVRGEATDTSSTNGINSEWGDIVYVYESDAITSVAEADALAAVLLEAKRYITEDIEVSGVCNPALDVGDVIRVVEARSNTNHVFRVQSLTIPMHLNAMMIQGKRLREITEEDMIEVSA